MAGNTLGSQGQVPRSRVSNVCMWVDQDVDTPCGTQVETPSQFTEHIIEMHIPAGKPTIHCCLWQNCKRAGKSFKDEYDLLRHIRVHTGQKLFRCNYPACSRKFSRSETLRNHERTHTGEKPYFCSFAGCGKRFSQLSGAMQHSAVHTNSTPYVCDVGDCKRAYSRLSSLWHHKAGQHKDVPPRGRKEGVPELPAPMDLSSSSSHRSE